MSDVMANAIEVGDFMFKKYRTEHGGCDTLMLEWAKERFYGLLVQEFIPKFDELHNMLVDKGHTSYKTCSEHGDMDYSVWAEKVKNPDDLKVIVSICHCACRDDNTLILIKSGFKYDEKGDTYEEEYLRSLMRSMMNFRAVRTWPRQITSKGYKCAVSEDNPTGRHTWGDHRDIKQASLATHRRDSFKYGYRDGRDEGHVFTYEMSHRGPRVEKAHWNENDIPRALEELDFLLCDLRGDHG